MLLPNVHFSVMPHGLVHESEEKLRAHFLHTGTPSATGLIITRWTAGLAFWGTGLCSYRARGVDGSCAKHLTVESYTVVMLLTVILIIISFPSPTHSFIPPKTSFSANPSHRCLSFSSSGLTTWIPQTVYCLLSISIFTFLLFTL